MRRIVIGTLAVVALACGSSDEGDSRNSGSGAGSSEGSGAGPGEGGSGAGGVGGGNVSPDVHLIGRFDKTNPTGPRFAWPGSEVQARFKGTGIQARLHDTGSNYLTVVIDDGAPTVLELKGPDSMYTLAKELPDGEHTVLLSKRTESSLGIVQLLDLAPIDGEILPSPPPYDRHIEVVGDSISAGYGNEGNGPDCSFSAATENEHMTYGAIASRALSAGHTTLAISGIGAYRSYDGTTEAQMPVRFLRTLAEDATSLWDFSLQPDVVVVNLGTNDFSAGDPGQPFIDAYTAFAEDLRTRYPDAHILCAVGPMLSDGFPQGEMRLTRVKQHLQTVIDTRQQAGDTRIGFVDLGELDPADGLGCDYHPNLTTHEKMATRLVDAIEAATGW
ncbi:SGNH/GDSL hydrolase family protein [Chondromyces crocatus]|uniref:Endo-1,4-beta-glucanase n=1 Tax=Chondromyces crocatus TaxID=52 RepID=A0A0K1EKG5_CHOCO|nr:SGNH/GDSL hydrolase family protein [Chondromyces crocatus]AKT41365.1 endo-1,4-beta-glucanase [Chondromyces crocatus]